MKKFKSTTNLNLVLLIISLLAYSPFSFGEVASDAREVISSNNYNVDRDLGMYQGFFTSDKDGIDFKKLLLSIGSTGHLLDSGAGNIKILDDLYNITLQDRSLLKKCTSCNSYRCFKRHKFADTLLRNSFTEVTRILNSFLFNDNRDAEVDFNPNDPSISFPNLTAVTYKSSEERKLELKTLSSEGKELLFKRANLLEGRFLEEIPNEDLTFKFGLVDVLTDVYGVMAYTENPSLILEKYAAVLKEEGKIFILLDINGFLSSPTLATSMVINRQTNQSIDLETWIRNKTKDCFDIGVYHSNGRHDLGLDSFRKSDVLMKGKFMVLSKKKSSTKDDCLFPKLKLRSLTKDTPPKRVFYEENL